MQPSHGRKVPRIFHQACGSHTCQSKTQSSICAPVRPVRCFRRRAPPTDAAKQYTIHAVSCRWFVPLTTPLWSPQQLHTTMSAAAAVLQQNASAYADEEVDKQLRQVEVQLQGMQQGQDSSTASAAADLATVLGKLCVLLPHASQGLAAVQKHVAQLVECLSVRDEHAQVGCVHLTSAAEQQHTWPVPRLPLPTLQLAAQHNYACFLRRSFTPCAYAGKCVRCADSCCLSISGAHCSRVCSSGEPRSACEGWQEV
jgi:hypothetical protein